MTDTDEERDRAAWEERVARVMIAPGSWHARDLQVVDEHGELVLTAIARPGHYAHQIASTRLAAAAPDLSAALLACRDRLAAIERDTDERTEIAVADAALAKTRGPQQNDSNETPTGRNTDEKREAGARERRPRRGRFGRGDRMSADPYPLAPEAFARFGERRQLLSLAEELSEASAAVARLLNEKGSRTELLTELVDVESVTASVRAALGPPEAWDAVRAEKRAKLARTLASGVLRTRPEGSV